MGRAQIGLTQPIVDLRSLELPMTEVLTSCAVCQITSSLASDTAPSSQRLADFTVAVHHPAPGADRHLEAAN